MTLNTQQREEAQAHEDNIYFKQKSIKDDDETKLDSENVLLKMREKL